MIDMMEVKRKVDAWVGWLGDMESDPIGILSEADNVEYRFDREGNYIGTMVQYREDGYIVFFSTDLDKVMAMESGEGVLYYEEYKDECDFRLTCEAEFNRIRDEL